jgi:hypothetical protein
MGDTDMEPSTYRDLLWDFTQEPFGRSKEVTLRVFSSEQELFESRGKGGQAFRVFLPIDKAAMSKGYAPESQGLPVDPDALAQMGRQLWEALPADATAPLEQSGPDQPVRLKISSNSPGIDDLPWEWLSDGAAGPPLALRGGLRLTRSAPVMLPLPPLSLRPPFRVLLVISNPHDEKSLDAYREIEAVRPALSRDPYKLDILGDTTWEAFNEALRAEPQPAIVHYVGHAGIDRGEGNLILQDSSGRSHWIAGSELSQRLPVTVGLMCLSTCATAPNYQISGLSRLAQMPASYRLPTCVVTRYAVTISGVQRFWEVFYAELAQHGNAVEAHSQAQRAVALDAGAMADWGSFCLVIRDQTGQVMRITTRGPLPMKRNEQEIVARVTAQMANDSASQSLVVGDLTSDLTWAELDQKSKAAQKYSRGL